MGVELHIRLSLGLGDGWRADAALTICSESSLFVAPHLIILKTCGTTLNLLGLHRIIEIAREYCGFSTVWRYVSLISLGQRGRAIKGQAEAVL